jgi:hypothetical protein
MNEIKKVDISLIEIPKLDEESLEKIPKSPLLNDKSELVLSQILAPFSFDIGGTMTKIVYLDFENREEKIEILKKRGENVKEEEVKTIINLR